MILLLYLVDGSGADVEVEGSRRTTGLIDDGPFKKVMSSSVVSVSVTSTNKNIIIGNRGIREKGFKEGKERPQNGHFKKFTRNWHTVIL